MKNAGVLKLLVPVGVLGFVGVSALADHHEKAEAAMAPLKILLVAGGCCHDYPVQTQLLEAGLEERLNADVVVHLNPDTTTKARYEVFEKEGWAEEYDLVIHDECSADVTDMDYINGILKPHAEGVPAVNLHCAAHSFRFGNFKEPVAAGADNAAWYEFQGIQSSSHGPKEPIELTFADATHPIVVGMEPWTTINEELYNNLAKFPNAQPVIHGKQVVKPKGKNGEKADPNAVAKEVNEVVAWTNLYGEKKTKVFSLTLGHENETVGDDRYLDLVSRGILWALDAINEDGSAKPGFGR